jgi:hypothetical protein
MAIMPESFARRICRGAALLGEYHIRLKTADHS